MPLLVLPLWSYLPFRAQRVDFGEQFPRGFDGGLRVGRRSVEMPISHHFEKRVMRPVGALNVKARG